MPVHLNTILSELQQIAPLEFAETWDNVGLLVGDRDRHILSAMTCLTLTNTTLQEAIDEKVELVVCHHPIPFKPLNKLTGDTTTGKLLLRAISAGIAIYSPHTAWDNAATGINQQLAEMLELDGITALQPFAQLPTHDTTLGIGRYGRCKTDGVNSIEAVFVRLSTTLHGIQPRHTHSLGHSISKIGIICGSGGSMLGLVASRGCDAMLTGEATYHQCLEAESLGIAMILIGHHASESFAMKSLAVQLQQRLPECRIIASSRETSLF
ncbi:MAG: Nif3-like dinuclear metal center hexameric protein [Pirellula sp.]